MSVSHIRPAKKVTLSEDVCQQLIGLIAAGEFVPGEKLPSEHELMDEFSVGRSTIREALRSLALLGVVETRQGDGTYVCNQDMGCFTQPIAWRALVGVRDGLELMEARRALEAESAALAARRSSPSELKVLDRLVREMDANLSNRERFARLDLQFHLAIAEIAGNQVLLQLLSSLRDLVQPYIKQDLNDPELVELSAEQHGDIFEAISGGDEDLARQVMRYHINDVASRLRAGLFANQEAERRPSGRASTS